MSHQAIESLPPKTQGGEKQLRDRRWILALGVFVLAVGLSVWLFPELVRSTNTRFIGAKFLDTAAFAPPGIGDERGQNELLKKQR